MARKVYQKRQNAASNVRASVAVEAVWCCDRCWESNLMIRDRCWSCSWQIPNDKWQEHMDGYTAQGIEVDLGAQRQTIHRLHKNHGKRGARASRLAESV